MPQLTKLDLAVIESCYRQKNWAGKKICIEFPGKGWTVSSVNRAIKRLVETGSNSRRPGSGRPVTATHNENLQEVEHLTLSQENRPGTHLSQRKIAQRLRVSRSSVQRMHKRLDIRCYKRLQTPAITEGAKLRRSLRASRLYRRFGNADVTRLIFQDEKDFTLQIPQNRQNNRVYSRTRKRDIPPNRLYHHKSNFSKKLIVSLVISCNGKSRFFYRPSDY